MTLTEIQDELNKHEGPYGDVLKLSVSYNSGTWHATVTNVQHTCVGPCYSASAESPELAAEKAAKMAIKRAPVEAWPYKGGYVCILA